MAAQRGFVPPQKLDGSHRCVPCAPVDETPDFEELGCNLPPLPKPNLPVMRSEACCGICVVVGIVAICVTATTSAASSLPVGIGGPLIALVLCEAFVALGCLGYLMWGDPGVVRRTRAACLPVPPEVLEKLAGIEHPQPLAGMRNIQDRGRTYCVRCCLWRDAPPGHLPRSSGDSQLANGSVHHCSICQRCVRDFDHHCGVFGRCIAGSTWSGNMPYFKLIIAMAVAGLVTTLAAAAFHMGKLIEQGPNGNLTSSYQ